MEIASPASRMFALPPYLELRIVSPGAITSSSVSAAISQLDGTPSLLEWKPGSSRFREGPDSALALDLELVCDSA